MAADRNNRSAVTDAWPSLPLDEWKDTYATLHMWMQIVGKIRLRQSAMLNHWWHVPLYVTARGLTTSPIPYEDRSFQIDFDFLDHQLLIRVSDGQTRTMPLEPRTVSSFYRELMAILHSLGLEVTIWSTPVEVPDPIPFEQDHLHAAYDAEYAQRFWHILLQADRLLKEFRSGFVGKCSPVHFFWGSFDLAVTRFSGRRAPKHPSVPYTPDSITHEAYSHEVSSCGFWPGGAGVEAAFYAYAYPQPPGFDGKSVHPKQAFYSRDFGEFLLPYDAVRLSDAPDQAVLDFLRTTYEAAADCGGWDRIALERALVNPSHGLKGVD